ncbi:MAG: hypothetical protein LBT46_00655 [Planctomycetaceae bacterium]|jgi:hypothetical protein|nr:hypothetical protein [Planctomycetaceae bacterium]
MKYVITMTLLLLAAGCGGSRVTGKVAYEDGAPVAHGTIVFTTDKVMYSGTIQKGGNYALGVTQNAQRIPFGTYKVWLSGTERVEDNIGGYIPKGELVPPITVSFPQVSPEFASSSKTPHTAEVHSGRVQFDFVIKRHPEWDKQQK